ncbi:MAG: DUF4143 domain-containing protein [Planctomycetota bacterium]
MIRRPHCLSLWRELARDKAMIFLSGPRQTGKTTLARTIAEDFYLRWSGTYHRQIIREDIRNLRALRHAESLEVLFSLLPSKVGSPMSIHGIAQDLETSFHTVKSWLDLFESFFLILRLPPWTSRLARAIRKERKPYLLDPAQIVSPAARFENLVALELSRAVSNWNDLGLGRFSLHYLRNKEGEEVDFLIANRNAPMLLIETKLAEESAPASLRKFQDALGVPAVLLVDKPGIYRTITNGKHRILAATASRWVAGLP